MTFTPKTPTAFALIGLLAMPITANLSAQELAQASNESTINVFGSVPSDLTGLEEGPKIEGFISAREDNTLQITGLDGQVTAVRLSQATDIKAKGGFLGLASSELGAAALLSGLPVSAETVQWNNGLIASKVRFSSSDLETAQMIRNGTQQQFAQQGAAITRNAAAAEALRNQVANIDQYNVRSSTNVHFGSNQSALSRDAQYELCSIARQAQGIDNAILLVLGHTDSTGSQEANQVVSERRAARAVNYLQQECSWAPYRMLAPAGMAGSDPIADNLTAEGRRQNRRVSVNILVSKAVDN